jgi:3-dehydroquinate dehydratase
MDDPIRFFAMGPMTKKKQKKLTKLTTFDALVEAMGGTAAIGRMMGQPTSAICNYRRLDRRKSRKGQFPAKYYFKMQKLLARHGYKGSRDLWNFVDD